MYQLAFWPQEMCEQVTKTASFTVVHTNHLDYHPHFKLWDYASQFKWWVMKLRHGISGIWV